MIFLSYVITELRRFGREFGDYIGPCFSVVIDIIGYLWTYPYGMDNLYPVANLGSTILFYRTLRNSVMT
jgi:hypothetical protein